MKQIKKKKKKKEKLWCQIRYLIRSITKISDDYGKIYMKQHLIQMTIYL